MNGLFFAHLKTSWSNHRPTLFATVVAMSLVLSALSTVLLARQNLVLMADAWGQDSELTVYLDESLSSDGIEDLQSKIKKLDGVANARFVSKTESAQKFLKKMGHLAPDFLENTKDNPLPATLDIHLSAGISLTDRLENLKKVATFVSEMGGVQDVSYGQNWMNQWSKFVQKFNFVTLGFTAVVLLLGLLVIGNAIRVSLNTRREEIEIMELVGATASWIRGPFIFEGILIGLLSALLSLLISVALNSMVLGYMSESGWMWVNPNQLRLSVSSIFFVILTGTAFGGLGAYLCVRKVNSGWSAGVALD